MASGADLRVAYVPETTFGTTPSTPSFQTLRVTSGGLSTSKATEVSQEIRSDKNVTDELQVGQSVSGNYPVEMTYGSFDDLMAAALGGAWSSDVLKNGTTPQFFTIEETIERGATDTFRRFTGCAVNSMSLEIETQARITGSFDIVGKQEILAEAAISGATYAAANTNTIMVAGTSIGTITIGSLTDNCVQNFTLEATRNYRPIQCIGSIFAEDMNTGITDVTGTVMLYFKNNAAYQAVLNHETASIAITIGHDANNKYTIEIPRARWLEGSMTVGGNDDDIMVEMPFRATYDATEQCSIKITRAVA